MLPKEKISFYPGPSQVYPQVGYYLQEAIRSNVTGYNHRSNYFIQMSEGLSQRFIDKLDMPADYKVGFLSSATETWACLANSFKKLPFINFYNGSFGEKWCNINSKVNDQTQGRRFEVNEELVLGSRATHEAYLIGVCQNETSNGTQISNERLAELRKTHPDALIAIDATSSMAGIKLDYKHADIWFASVQKCFGLPAGLGIVLMSSRVKDYFPHAGQEQYNNIVELYNKASVFQTIYTPNVLGIYLLYRLMQDLPHIQSIDATIKRRAAQWRNFFKVNNRSLLCTDNLLLSDTVLAVKSSTLEIKTLLKYADDNGFIMGKGYGAYIDQSFRIANFPAHSEQQVSDLEALLNEFWNSTHIK
ncbi:MAG TPA: aminotransferase class V-fold PLP-dependent enzyme [Cytophagales bacterium]|nr:aminotransferase class V-fold PLP-dependent enzyme [Cytophagales bacterium]